MATSGDKPISIYCLLRFDSREHLKDLRRDGLLFMNSLSYFIKLESDPLNPLKGDVYEGTDHITQPKHIGQFAFYHPSVGKTEADQSELGAIRTSLDRTKSCNVYCMVAITRLGNEESVDKRNINLGDYFVCVTNPKEFLNRISRAAQQHEFHGECELIKYYDQDEYSGKLSRFNKRSIYSYQNEFRVVIESCSKQPLRFYIGDIQDITSEALPSSEVNSFLDFSA
jgi:hypothetical protein